ncbi:MAG: hypothetical protein JJU20_13050 [Opitutales bacterium]|nr:hypothetical protein [Opitutales bacterium]
MIYRLPPVLLALLAPFCALFAQEVPPPAAAYIQQIALDPQQPEILYLATTSSGLYRTINGGAYWTELNADAELRRYYAVQLDPLDSRRLFAGGEESGLWESLDRGQSWQLRGLDGVTVLSISVDPQQSDRLFVLAPEGVYRTEAVDSEPWELVFDYREFLEANWREGMPEDLWQFMRFIDVEINPHDPDDIFLGARWEGGYHRSRDGGETWQHHSISGIFRRADIFRFHPEDSNRIYIGTHHQGLFVSYNNGESWVAQSRGLEPQIREPFYGAYLVSGLAFEPGNSDVMYTGTDYSNWKSVDGGRSWTELGRTLTCEFARSFAVDTQNPQIVYAGTNVGMYRSEDGGESWTSINRGFPEREILDTLELEIEDEWFEYAVVQGRPAGYRRSLSAGSDWLPMGWLLYTDADAIDFDDASGALLLNTPGGIVRSYDGGFRWELPAVEYAPVVNLPVRAPEAADPERGDIWSLDVSIEGDIFFEDQLVNPLYQRPPYVSLQLVSPEYPCDGSVPLWEGNFERYLNGTIQIPEDRVASGENYLLYVEVRDFQRNVLVGAESLSAMETSSVRIQVSPNRLAPCLEAVEY